MSATPPLTATPGDYRLGVTAQSRLTPELLLSAEHLVTVLPVDGVALDVRPDPIFTIPWGPDNQLQLPDAGYTLWVTNTSNIARTFDVNLTGLEADWLLFNGQTGQDAASVNLTPGGVALVGLYISPTLTALPPAGTFTPLAPSSRPRTTPPLRIMTATPSRFRPCLLTPWRLSQPFNSPRPA